MPISAHAATLLASPSQTLSVLSIAVIAGCLFGGVGASTFWIAVLLCIVSSVLAFFIRRPMALLLAIVLVSFSLGSFRGAQQTRSAVPAPSASSSRVSVEGIVVDIPQSRGTTQRFLFRPDAQPQRDSATLVVVMGQYPEVARGERLRLACTLRGGEPPQRCVYAEVLALQPAGPLAMLSDAPREWYRRGMRRAFPEPVASLLLGVTSGGMDGMSEVWRERFIVSGTSHLVALSGYNVTIIVGTMWSLLRWLCVPRRFRLLLAGTLVTIFVAVVGGGSSLVRASLMGLLGTVALHLGRPSSATPALLAAATVMTLHDPAILFDVGFQLSCAATAGIFFIYSRLQARWHLDGGRGVILDAALLSVSAQVAVLPILLTVFGSVSLISPLTNTILSFFIPPMMFFGFLGGVVGTVSSFFGFLVGSVAYGAAVVAFLIIRGTAEIPGVVAHVTLPTWVAGASYIAVAVWYACTPRRARLTLSGKPLY